MMLKSLVACLSVPALAAAAFAQSPADRPAAKSEWTVTGGPAGCIAYATSGQGTVVSILAGPGEENLVFLVQNPAWSLRDGDKVHLAVELDSGGAYQFEAVAKTNLDQDGPGLIFSVPPTAPFLTEFAAAAAMDLDRNGQKLDTLPLQQAEATMSELAHCMATMWGVTAEEEGVPIAADAKAMKL